MNPLTAIRSWITPDPRVNAPVSPLDPAATPPLIPPAALASVPTAAPAETAGASFNQMLTGLVQEVSAKQSAAAAATQGLLSGNQVSLHQAVIAMEEAGVAFQLMVEVRNKLLESYQELMRMQL